MRKARYPVIDGKKECSGCHIAKPVSDFCTYNSKRYKQVARVCKGTCKACDAVHRKGRYEKLTKEEKAMIHRRVNLKRNYGITPEIFDEMLKNQGGVCLICGDPPEVASKDGVLHVDHCHITGSVRGLLCHHCNCGLGHYKDTPSLLRKAADYIEQHENAYISALL